MSRWSFTAVTLTAVLALVACGSADPTSDVTTSPTSATPVVTTSVLLKGGIFTPPAILVAPGSTVTFTNEDASPHNVTFDDAAIPRSGDYSAGGKSLTMPIIPGTYGYRCTIHANMTGSVKVQ